MNEKTRFKQLSWPLRLATIGGFTMFIYMILMIILLIIGLGLATIDTTAASLWL